MVKECTEKFPETPEQDYRYFNQPIEQIPGFNKNKSQLLFHAEGCGLVWQDIAECVDLVKCAKVSGEGEPGAGGSYKLIVEQQRIRPLQDLGAVTEPSGCDPIPLEPVDVITCIKIEEEKLKFDWKRLYVLKQETITEPSGSCPPIDTINCSTTPAP